MFSSIRFALIVLVCLAAGCGRRGAPPKEVCEGEKRSGTVETSLPPELQANQEALRLILDALALQGMDFDEVDSDPNLRFEQSAGEFFEPGAINLARWHFAGKPTGNRVPVVLYFNLDPTGRNQRKVKRVYEVTGSGRRFTIRPKP